MRVKRIGDRALPSSMASANPRPVSLLALEDCDGDGGVNNHSSESGIIEPQSDCVNVTPDSGGERVCDDAEKSHSGNIFGVDGNECDSSGEGCAGVENPKGEILDVDGNESDRVNVTLDSGGERVCANAEKPYGDISGGDAMEIDSLEEETCIKCNGAGEVLLCSETGCPVALHEKCVGSEAIFDEMGKFYCPYCLYKRAIVQTRELKEKAMEAKKELSSFLYPKVVGGDKEEGKGKQTNVLHGNGNHLDHDNVRDNGIVENQFGKGAMDRQTEGEENIAKRDRKHREVANHQKHMSPHAARDYDTICHGQEETIRGIEDLRDSLEREKQCEDETSAAHQFEVGTVQEEELREHEHGSYEGLGGNRQQAETSNACHTNDETNVDNSLNTSTEQAMDGVKVSEEIPWKNKEQGTVQAEELTEYKHSPHVGVGDDRQQAETSVDVSLNTSTKQALDSAKVSEEIHMRNKEQIQPLGQKTAVSAAIVKYERRAKQRTQNSGNPYSFDSPSKSAAQLKDVEDTARSQMVNPLTSKVESRYYAEKSCKYRMERDAATNKSRQQQKSTRQAPIFFNGKRKRLLWTAEEEEMIKKGVNIMSSPVSKKIPWRKILESGSHVFHPSRNPSDLKDKWKTLS